MLAFALPCCVPGTRYVIVEFVGQCYPRHTCGNVFHVYSCIPGCQERGVCSGLHLVESGESQHAVHVKNSFFRYSCVFSCYHIRIRNHFGTCGGRNTTTMLAPRGGSTRRTKKKCHFFLSFTPFQTAITLEGKSPT